MKLLVVDIIKYMYFENDYPGWVICSFIDAFGKTWYIEEKAPVVSSDDITENTKLPTKGYIGGEIISQDGDIVCFCTKEPWDIESRDGENKFYVFERQLVGED